jgi:DNA-binding transcriptional MerR regulator/methylmalonyl-CoA mutase cobalamin-binding subunit
MTLEHDISSTANLTGIPKDLLRMWERRYGFPNPERDANGDRLYSLEQVDKLSLIKQLLDRGKRPGKLVGLEVQALREMLTDLPIPGFEEDILLQHLKQKNAVGLQQWLKEQMLGLGLRNFVHEWMVPAIRSVGCAWARGDISIFEEHLFTEMLVNHIRQHLADQRYQGQGEPRIMLTTVPGEKHCLGLLMVEALLHLGGAEVIPFGTEMPFQEIREAAEQHKVDVIGLSFSGSFQGEDALVLLAGLRQLIPARIQIWAGGAALTGHRLEPEGVKLMPCLETVEETLKLWKSRTSSRN